MSPAAEGMCCNVPGRGAVAAPTSRATNHGLHHDRILPERRIPHPWVSDIRNIALNDVVASRPPGVFHKKLVVLGFRLFFMPPLFPVDIRGADRRGRGSLPLGNHEFGGGFELNSFSRKLLVSAVRL